MNLTDLQFIRHRELLENKLLEICHLKNIVWPYTIEKQQLWIKNNIENDDYHILMYIDNILVAYLNLINISVIINNQTYGALGIGNVCSRERSKGYGIKIMSFINDYLIKHHSIGLLFCKNELVRFYEANHWRLIDKGKLTLVDENTNFETMIFNFEITDIEVLQYDMKRF